MMPQHHLPADIERTSMKIIAGELAQRGLDIPPENAPVVKRVTSCWKKQGYLIT